MSAVENADLLCFAKELLATFCRAFFEDVVVCVVDLLLRDDYIRDDDIASGLYSLSKRQIRRALQFLKEERWVDEQTIKIEPALPSSPIRRHRGRYKEVRFCYLDFDMAVITIRLRLDLMRNKLVKEALELQNETEFECPGHSQRRCNGRYTESEALQCCLNGATGEFFCRECAVLFEHNPEAPPFQLFLVDHSKRIEEIEASLRRLDAQLESKVVESTLLRKSIKEQMARLQGKRIPFLLPSELLDRQNRFEQGGINTQEGDTALAFALATKAAQSYATSPPNVTTLEQAFQRLATMSISASPSPGHANVRTGRKTDTIPQLLQDSKSCQPYFLCEPIAPTNWPLLQCSILTVDDDDSSMQSQDNDGENGIYSSCMTCTTDNNHHLIFPSDFVTSMECFGETFCNQLERQMGLIQNGPWSGDISSCSPEQYSSQLSTDCYSRP